MSSKTAKKVTAAPKPAPAKPKIAAKIAAKPAANDAAKVKVAAKTGGKKAANPKNAAKNAEAAIKKQAEQQRYTEALALAADQGLVTIFDHLPLPTVQDKWTTAVGLHILETINTIQQSEIRKDGDYNPYPAKNFLLFEDKVSANGKKKAPVKNSKTESSVASKKKRPPLKRGTKIAVAEPNETAEAEEPQIDDSPELDDTPTEEETKEKTSEDAKEGKKRNITTFTRDAKNYLGFFVMRFVDDYFSSLGGGKGVKNRDDITNFTYVGITKDINSHVSRSVVTTVNRMGNLVSNLADRGIPKELTDLISSDFGPSHSALIKFMGDYLSDYFKLVGYILAQQLWVSRKVINQQAIEAVVRILDIGNHEFRVDHKVVNEGELDYELSCGFYQDAHVFSALTLPKKPKSTGAAGTAKGKKASKAPKASKSKKAPKAAGENADDGGEDGEAAGAAEDDDEDDAEVEEEEEDSGNAAGAAEDDVEDDVEVEVEEEDADAEDKAEEEVEEDAEEEVEAEEPEPAPKKPLMKLK